jgi:hypothetical protein
VLVKRGSESPLSGVNRKTCAHFETYRFDPLRKSRGRKWCDAQLGISYYAVVRL